MNLTFEYDLRFDASSNCCLVQPKFYNTPGEPASMLKYDSYISIYSFTDSTFSLVQKNNCSFSRTDYVPKIFCMSQDSTKTAEFNQDGDLAIKVFNSDYSSQIGTNFHITDPLTSSTFYMFDFSLNNDGNVIAISAYLPNNESLSHVCVYIYSFLTHNWEQFGSSIPVPYYSSITINSEGNTIFIASWNNTDKNGNLSLYSYQNQQRDWVKNSTEFQLTV